MHSSNTETQALGGSVAVLERPAFNTPAVDNPGFDSPDVDDDGTVDDRRDTANSPFAVPALALLQRTTIAHLPDDALMTLHSDFAELRQRTDSNLAVLADEIARRSHHTLGHDGLAQRLGSRTPENLIQRLTGVGAREAGAMVRVGSMLAGAEGLLGSDDPATTTDLPAGATDLIASENAWLRPLAVAVGEARLSVEAADAIGRGLGQPTVGVTPAHLERTASQLAAESALLTVEQLAVRARQARALLDLEAESELVDDREAALRDRRYLHLTRQADGMTRLNALLDPESAALVRDAVDAATSPRRDGPRFVTSSEQGSDELDANENDRALRMLADTRTTPQIALDAVVELIRLGGEVAPTEVIGVRSPAVQVIVAERDLREHRGLGFFEGQTEPVGTTTAERHVCASGVVPIVINEVGDVIALGRESRLFTRRQRIALAARDGGCRFPGCDRPPSWTEAHHIVPWSSGGSTDLHDGVLLCRHHHLLLHNNGWRFARVDGDLHVIPPPDIDAEQRPIPTPSKSVPLERARAG
ncbi:HNH endonuclease signature motif containing protein [Microcella sp.]|uniref:HNH endonuclease signature motif containing protein n=1 Tax=Microcella sp. TaxID=1913979 RepID=UPI0025652C3B|nr:HNH endonuclease signature motif containing protein [Microcella sp.]MBX9472972.1 HNH endonuclease [Microcella sp.]